MTAEDLPTTPAVAVATTHATLVVHFRCTECDGALAHDAEFPEQLLCQNPQCSSAGMAVALWRAQRARVRRGEDAPAPGAGWPRPVLAGLPHPWLTPVSDGIPWWKLLDGARRLQAQDAWLCQVCGLPLDEVATVLVKGRNVLSDTALHRRCQAIACRVCPHLAKPGNGYRVADVTRDDLLADGQALDPVRVNATNDDEYALIPVWTLADDGTSLPLLGHQFLRGEARTDDARIA